MPIVNDAHCPQHCPVEGNFPQPEKELLQPQYSSHPWSILSGHEPTHPSARPRGPSTVEGGWTGPILSRTGLERASNIHGSDWHTWTCPISVFSQGYCFTGSGSSLGHIPSSRGDLGRVFQLLAVTALWWDSVHGWTGASLQAGGLSASPAVAATCRRVLIGTAEDMAPHLRHALINLWINNCWKKGLLKIYFENVFQILPFSSDNTVGGIQGHLPIFSSTLRERELTVKYILI